MYFWKCWRDTRSRFIFFLIVITAVGVFFTVILSRKDLPDRGVVYLWSEVATVLGVLCSILALLAALSMAAPSIGQEFKEQTLGFLLTRPRRRRYWIWTCWAVGACELGLVIFVAVVATFGTVSFVSGRVYTWRLLVATLPMFTGAVAVYSLTYLLTVLARSIEQGISYGLGILIVDLCLPLVGLYWHVHLSSVMSFMMAGCAWAASPKLAFPLGQLAIYAAVALAFPLAAQLVLERAEA
jgi:ABC-type transport system involved in multi-copper enzyme maturation permease subunit